MNFTGMTKYDIPFVALSIELECPLWTGDKKLLKGLKKAGFGKIVNTIELIKIRDI